jgi:hypothetical protein
MRQATVFHPLYYTHPMPSVNGFDTAHGKVYRNSGRPEWEPGVGNTSSGDQQIWEGPLRVQPNIDWRARTRDVQGEYDATMATRITLPMLRNEYNATRDANNNIVTYSPDPVFAFGDVVEVTTVSGPGQRTLLKKRYTVRNALPSTNMWEHDLLTDVGTTLHG